MSKYLKRDKKNNYGKPENYLLSKINIKTASSEIIKKEKWFSTGCNNVIDAHSYLE